MSFNSNLYLSLLIAVLSIAMNTEFCHRQMKEKIEIIMYLSAAFPIVASSLD